MGSSCDVYSSRRSSRSACHLLSTPCGEIETYFQFRKVNAPMTLNNVPHGQQATVLNVAESSASSIRLMEMGLVPGANVCVVRSAPFGDPLQVKLRDYHLALRRAEAQLIDVALDSAN